jgi:hypothetical protein
MLVTAQQHGHVMSRHCMPTRLSSTLDLPLLWLPTTATWGSSSLKSLVTCSRIRAVRSQPQMLQMISVPAAAANRLACAKMSCSLLMTGTMTSPSVSEGFERDMLPLLSG